MSEPGFIGLMGIMGNEYILVNFFVLLVFLMPWGFKLLLKINL